MKTLRILLILFPIAFGSLAQIPNASFENWYSYSLGEYPTGWTTSDSVSNAYGAGPNVYKGTDPFDGALSMHLKSVNTSFGIKGPGMATNGLVEFSGGAFVFSGGSPDTTRSRFLTGVFKYNPTNPNDEGQISVALLRDSAGFKDTIAFGVTPFNGTVSTYTPFTTALAYFDYVNNPDTCLIIIQSSRGINDANLGVGTELVIDSLNFSGTVGIEEANDVINSVNIFPSPAHNQLTVLVDLKRKLNLNCTIYDLTGKMVINLPFESNNETIDISSLAKGNYILKLSDDKNNGLYSMSFMKD